MRHCYYSWIVRALLCAMAGFASSYAAFVRAAPDEIVVFAGELEKKNDVGYTLHMNYAARARKTPDYPGEQAPHRVFRVMPEVVWGFADKWSRRTRAVIVQPQYALRPAGRAESAFTLS